VGAIGRVRSDLDNSTNRGDSYLILYNNYKDVDEKQIKNDIDNFIKALGNPHIIKVSKTATNKRQKIEATPKVLRFRGMVESDKWKHSSYLKYGVDSWYKSEVDMNTGGFYIPINRYTPTWYNDTEKEVNNITNILKWAEFLDIKNISTNLEDMPIYGVRKSELHVFKEHKKWKDLIEYLEEQILNFFVKKSTIKKLSRIKDLNEVNKKFIENFYVFDHKYMNGKKIINELPDESFFKRFESKFACITDQDVLYFEACNELANIFDIDLDISTNDVLLNNFEIIKEKYEMLCFVNSYSISDRDIQMIVNYITHIDKTIEV